MITRILRFTWNEGSQPKVGTLLDFVVADEIITAMLLGSDGRLHQVNPNELISVEGDHR